MVLDIRTVLEILGLAVASLLLITSIHTHFRSRRSSQGTDQSVVYQDEDGEASEETQKVYSVWVQNFLLLAPISVAGFSIALTEAVVGQLHSWPFANVIWLDFALWAILLSQTVLVLIERQPIARFKIASSTAGSFLIACLPTLWWIYSVVERKQTYFTEFHNHLEYAKFALAICGCLVTISYPRRPALTYRGRQVDGMMSATVWSRFTYEWITPLMKKARNGKKLDADDLPGLEHNIRTEDLYQRFKMTDWDSNFVMSLIKCHIPGLLAQNAFTAADSVLNLAPQVALYRLLQLLQLRDEGVPVGRAAIFWVAVLAVSQLVGGFVFSRMWFISEVYVAVPIRFQLPSLIFTKAMRKKDTKGAGKKEEKSIDDEEASENSSLLKKDSETEPVDEVDKMKKTRQGVVNLVGVDTKRISDFALVHNILFGAVIKLSIAFYFLYAIVGWQALLVGASIQLLFTPLNIHFSKKYVGSQDKLMKSRDRKLAVLNEALTGIRQIKFAALEDKWQKKIMSSRDNELASLWACMIADVALFALWLAGPVLLSAGCIATHALVYGTLDPATAFTTISLLSRIEVTLAYLPELMTNGADAWVSAKRIADYLAAPDKEDVFQHDDHLSFHEATISWPADEQDDDTFKLHNVNLEFPHKKLSVISGRTGSGKSLLLSALLGECELLTGSITVPKAPGVEERNDKSANPGNWILPDAFAYVPQIPWIENCSLKDNILFGLPYDEARYLQVIDACALTKDLEILVDGDGTEIGPNGINLSGGQCWRLTLARALYSRAGILILDDIFSAVDAHVGKHIYEKALTGPICEGRTRILVTHHVALCRPKTQYEVHLGNGGVEYAGKPDHAPEVEPLHTVTEENEEAVEVEDDDDIEATLNTANVQRRLSTVSRRLSRPSANASALQAISSKRRPSKATSNHPATEEVPKAAGQIKKFIEEEERETGHVRFTIYKQYLNACGGIWFWLGVVALFVGFECLLIGRTWVLRLWTHHSEAQVMLTATYTKPVLEPNSFFAQQKYRISAEDPYSDVVFWTAIYVGVSIVMVLEGTFRFLSVFYGSIKASRSVFERITHSVLRAPLRWLDTVPVGRILNRFTADFTTFDAHQAYGFSFAFSNVLQVFGIMVAGAFVSAYIMLSAVLLFVVCIYFAFFYLASARDTRRLESTAKSPIFEHFNAALQGVSIIRAFQKRESYISTMFDKLDAHARAIFHLCVYKRWLAWRLTVVGAIFTCIGSGFILAFRGMDAALGGFALTFMLGYNDSIFMLLRHLVEIELGMNSTERIIEYAEMETEAQGGTDVPASWPATGRLEVDNLVVAYAPDLEPVLRGLTFDVQPKQRVGVVGRTGAGKSSLTLALFRFLEAREGSIFVDGIDISKIKLYDLRSRLAIIPQDPVLFSGTIRSNLDPFDERSDSELNDALRRVHLVDEEPSPDQPSSSGSTTPRNTNANIFQSLSSSVAESGQNLSQGQRQLLCLARAIVARPKIMVLDEATSAVDKTTDGLIQRSIREEFEDSTLLVIAHRLSTIADFDRILVLDEGRVVEYGSPKELYAMKDGVFRGMVESSGEQDTLVGIMEGT